MKQTKKQASLNCLDSSIKKKEEKPQVSLEIEREEIEILDEIGRGNFASVFRAKVRGQIVAVKKPKASVFHGVTKDQLKAFRDEIGIVSTIFHPNLVLFMGVCFAGDEIMIISELLEGGNLQDLLEAKKEIPLFTRTKYGLQAALGLAWLHGRGVLHLDVKPANLLLKDGGSGVKLCDFGLSKMLPPGKHFKKSRARGTPLFTAPEIFMGDPFDHRFVLSPISFFD